MKGIINFILLVILVFSLLYLEIIKEDNYLRYKETTTEYYFNKSDNDVIIEGNYLTKATNSNDIFSSPFITHIKCIYAENKCIENYFQEIFNSLVYGESEYKILSIKDNIITAERETEKVKFILNINLITTETTIQQIPKSAKTGKILDDIGTTSAISLIVDSNTFKKENKKYHTDIINTPIRYIFKK